MSPLDALVLFIAQVFSMFGQLISYLIEAPGQTFYQIMNYWGNAFKPYGELIPIVFLSVLGLTGTITYALIVTAKDVEKVANVSSFIGAV